MDLFFLFDLSDAAVIGFKLAAVNRFIPAVASRLPIASNKVRLGIAYFAGNIQLSIGLADGVTHRALIDTFQGATIGISGDRDTGAAFGYLTGNVFGAGRDGDRPFVPNYAVLVVDGPSQSQNTTLLGMYKAKAQGIRLITVGVTSQASRSELAEIASPPSDYYQFYIDSYDHLNSISDALVDKLCSPIKPVMGEYMK